MVVVDDALLLAIVAARQEPPIESFLARNSCGQVVQPLRTSKFVASQEPTLVRGLAGIRALTPRTQSDTPESPVTIRT
jgi:hypothetical protein